MLSNRPAGENSLNAALRHAPLIFGTLLVITILLLLWNHVGMERVVEISGRSGHPFLAASDIDTHGGSVARLVQDGKAQRLDCQLSSKLDWPYCKLSYTLSNDGNGLDLNELEYVTVDIDYAGPGPSMAKLVLLNFERGRYRLDDWTSRKVHETEAFEIVPGKVSRFPINVFYVAGWWKRQSQQPMQQTGVNLDNVVQVDFMNAAEAKGDGHHVYTLRAIRFHGKVITKSKLLSLLIGMWITVAIVWSAMLSVTLRRDLDQSKAQLRLLSEVNRALKLETEQLAGHAHHDPLTGVLNREGLRAALMSTSTLLNAPMSVVFLDIDHFKRVNDDHGHAVGDEVLRLFAATVGTHIRASDQLVRWGGEEFLLVCPGCDLQNAIVLAEKLRIALMEGAWPHALAVTASFGVAQHDPNEEISNVIDRADQQLYAAKKAGRNRVHADDGGDASRRAA